MVSLVPILAAICPICLSTGHLGSYAPQNAYAHLARAAGLTGGEIEPSYRIMWAESRGNPRAENPRSSAAGLFQKIESLHGEVSVCPIEQVRWADKYATNRYGGWSRAWTFHRKNGWW